MQPIPPPQVLDPDRVLDNDRNHLTPDHEARAALLEDALRHSCDYAEQLWQNLNAVRGYLLTSLPPDPRSPEPHTHACASPTGPADEQGWADWIATYSTVTSTLCGPHGDSGFGLGEARREAELRRSAPILTLSAEHPSLGHPQHLPNPAQPEARRVHAEPEGPSRSRLARSAALTVLLALAARGLRPRRRANTPSANR